MHAAPNALRMLRAASTCTFGCPQPRWTRTPPSPSCAASALPPLTPGVDPLARKHRDLTHSVSPGPPNPQYAARASNQCHASRVMRRPHTRSRPPYRNCHMVWDARTGVPASQAPHRCFVLTGAGRPAPPSPYRVRLPSRPTHGRRMRGPLRRWPRLLYTLESRPANRPTYVTATSCSSLRSAARAAARSPAASLSGSPSQSGTLCPSAGWRVLEGLLLHLFAVLRQPLGVGHKRVRLRGRPSIGVVQKLLKGGWRISTRVGTGPGVRHGHNGGVAAGRPRTDQTVSGRAWRPNRDWAGMARPRGGL